MNLKTYNKLFIIKPLGLSVLMTLTVISCASDPSETAENSIVSDVIPEDANNTETNDTEIIEEDQLMVSQYSFQTVFNEGQSWGYQLLDSGKVFINQPHIPAVSGNKGFSSEEKAIKCAEFALIKIDQGMIPPTLTKIELDSLGVLD